MQQAWLTRKQEYTPDRLIEEAKGNSLRHLDSSTLPANRKHFLKGPYTGWETQGRITPPHHQAKTSWER